MRRLWSDFEPFSLRGVVILSLLFGLANALVRLSAGGNLALDDAKENLFTQTFEWGYLPDNPPLYEWTLTLVQQLTGPTILSFLIVKYALMVLTAAFLFLAGRRIYRSEKWAALAAYGAILLFQLGYNYHQAFSHSLMVIAMTVITLWAFVRLVQEGRFTDYLLFGVAVGLGLLSKYNFTGFLVVILLAGMVETQARRVLLNPRLVLAAAIAAVIAAPHLLWVQAHQELFLSYVSNKLGQTSGSHLARVGEGIGNMLVAVLSFFLPLLIVIGLLFRGAISRRAVTTVPDDYMLRILRRTLMVALALMLAGIVIGGVANVTERYVIPFLLPAYFWLIGECRHASSPADVRRFGQVIAGAAGIILIVRFINVFYPGAPVCDDCQRWRPFYAIDQVIEQNGLDRDAIYIGYEENTAGNLRRLLPQADVRSFNLLFYQPMKAAGDRPCYFVWSEELLGQPVEQKVRHITEQKSTLNVSGEWRHPLRAGGWRQTSWGISPVPADSPLFPVLCQP